MLFLITKYLCVLSCKVFEIVFLLNWPDYLFMSWLNKVNQEKVLCLYTWLHFSFLFAASINHSLLLYAKWETIFSGWNILRNIFNKNFLAFFSASFPYWKRKGEIELIGKKVLIYLNWAPAQFMCSVYNLNQSGYCLKCIVSVSSFKMWKYILLLK